jgi:predicted PurR-regulated permease PerM
MSTAPQPEQSGWRHRRTDILIAVGVAALVALVVVFRAVLAPLGVALAVAYILNPLMRWAERRRIPRGLSATLLFLGLVVLVTLAALFVLPPLVGQLYDFGVKAAGEPAAEEPPGYKDLNGNGQWDTGYLPAVLTWAEEVSTRLGEGADTWHGRLLQQMGRSLAGAKDDLLGGALNVLKRAGAGVLGFLWDLQGFVVGAALTAFYLFFFLMSFDRMVDAVRARLPGLYRDRMLDVCRKIDAAVSAFLRGRLIICLTVGALTGVGLAIVGVPYWFLLGVVTGLAGIVPFMPIFVGLLPALAVAWFDSYDPWTVVGAGVVYIVVQTLEGWVLTPFIQGRAVGLHPVTLTVALLVGWQVLGLFGLIMAVPLASTIKILAREFVLPKVDELAAESPDGGAPPGRKEKRR